MRTTLTLDEDVAARLKAEARRAGKPFKAIVNEKLRLGLDRDRKGRTSFPPFVVAARELGPVRPGLSLDDIGALLEAAEGPLHR